MRPVSMPDEKRVKILHFVILFHFLLFRSFSIFSSEFINVTDRIVIRNKYPNIEAQDLASRINGGVLAIFVP